MNFYALNEAPINGHATLMGTSAASLVLTGAAHGVKAIKGSAAALIDLSAAADSMVYWHPHASPSITVSASALGKIAIKGRAAAAVAVTASARPMLRAQAKASGQVNLDASGAAHISFRPKASMPIALLMTADGHIVRVHYPKADMLIMLDAGGTTKVARAVFCSAKFEPITIDARARSKMITRGKAAGLIALHATAASKGYMRQFSSARGTVQLHTRSSSVIWRRRYGSAEAMIKISMRYGGGTRPIPSVYAPAPADRTMTISADQRLFTIAADERAL